MDLAGPPLEAVCMNNFVIEQIRGLNERLRVLAVVDLVLGVESKPPEWTGGHGLQT